MRWLLPPPPVLQKKKNEIRLQDTRLLFGKFDIQRSGHVEKAENLWPEYPNLSLIRTQLCGELVPTYFLPRTVTYEQRRLTCRRVGGVVCGSVFLHSGDQSVRAIGYIN